MLFLSGIMRVFIFGLGYCGIRIAKHLSEHATSIVQVTRTRRRTAHRKARIRRAGNTLARHRASSQRRHSPPDDHLSARRRKRSCSRLASRRPTGRAQFAVDRLFVVNVRVWKRRRSLGGRILAASSARESRSTPSCR